VFVFFYFTKFLAFFDDSFNFFFNCVNISCDSKVDVFTKSTIVEKYFVQYLEAEKQNLLETIESAREINEEINKLGIGPLGFGGETTSLAVKIKAAARHPASYFVDVSFCCWACRRGKLEYD